MKNIKCGICGSENHYTAKYCRICFSRLHSIKKRGVLKTDFYTSVQKKRNIINVVLILVLCFIILLFIIK